MVRPRQISTEKILEIAAECFLEQGINVSTQVIADRVGLSQPALFKRFKTKKDLIIAALAPPERLPVIEWIDAGPYPGEFGPQLEALLEKLWETLQLILPRLMVMMVGNVNVEEFHKRYKVLPKVRLLMSVADWFRRAQNLNLLRADGNPEVWAQSCLGTLQGRAIMQFMIRAEFGPEDNRDYIKSVVDLLYRGMTPENDNATQ
jgi:AcrR family transcriptional regulator